MRYGRTAPHTKQLRGKRHFDWHNLPVVEIHTKMDDEFVPLFVWENPLLQQLPSKLREELLGALSSIANSPKNHHFEGNNLITTTTFVVDHICRALEAMFPPPNKLLQIYLLQVVEYDEIEEDLTIIGLAETYIMLLKPRDIPNLPTLSNDLPPN